MYKIHYVQILTKNVLGSQSAQFSELKVYVDDCQCMGEAQNDNIGGQNLENKFISKIYWTWSFHILHTEERKQYCVNNVRMKTKTKGKF